MATAFHIHEDIENKKIYRNYNNKTNLPLEKKENVKNGNVIKRPALQPLQDRRILKEANTNSTIIEEHANNEKIASKSIALNADVLKHNFIKTKKITKSEKNIVSIGLTEKEYEKEIWTNLFELETNANKIKPLYMTKQVHLNWNMRSILIDWLANVADEYEMDNQTFHLSVNYVDRFLSQISVIREKFQLVGAAAMLIASKVEEIYPPQPKEWSHLTGNAFTLRQIIKMEQLILKVLEFQLQPPTMLDFIKHYCAKNNFDTKTMYLAMYVSELVLLEGRDYLNYIPSKLAAAAIVLAKQATLSAKSEPNWIRSLEKSMGYNIKQLSPVVQQQEQTLRGSPFKTYQAIQKKYESPKYERVALLKPRKLKLDFENDCE